MPRTFPSVAKNSQYDFDLLVIGGGSGGLAASQAAARSDRKLRVGVFDYITPTPHGTTWGLGGTCVNVGCIPKKLFHTAGLVGASMKDYQALGWTGLERKHDWNVMRNNVNAYIKTLQDGYVDTLRSQAILYINSLATFTDGHTVSYIDPETKQKVSVTAEKFIISCGGRPRFPGIPGEELGISSDDIFWWKDVPDGKTLVVGASYIALECAGFLHEIGHDVTVAVRSILLRGFDRQCAEQVGEYMERHGTRFINPATPTRMERKDPNDAKSPIVVTLNVDGKEVKEEYNTVLWAIGRNILTKDLGLETTGVTLNRKGKILVDEKEVTSVPHIYAVGDAIATANDDPRPELTPVAIKAGKLLAKRIYRGHTKLMDYVHIPTTVFTPLEYGAVGLGHEEAIKKYGAENVETYFSRYSVLETALSDSKIPAPRSNCWIGENMWMRQHRLSMGKSWNPSSYTPTKFYKQPCLAKLVVDKKNDKKIIGFHYIGPNAGEVTQGFGVAVKFGITKAQLDDVVGIHPTSAEEFTALSTTFSSGQDGLKTGGC